MKAYHSKHKWIKPCECGNNIWFKITDTLYQCRVCKKMREFNKEDEIMELEKQVCNLKLSKKLQKLKVKQNSLYYWHWTDKEPSWFELNTHKVGYKPYVKHTSAFSVAELGKILKNAISYYSDNKWICSYTSRSETAKTEADARAKILIYKLTKTR